MSVFDTARAYAPDAAELGHNERLLARALRGPERARVVTKGGMTRAGGGWVPDGRAKAILADCEASLDALGGREIDLYLLMRPIRGRRGERQCGRWRSSPSRASSGEWACRTSTGTSSMRRATWRRSRPCRWRSACATTARSAAGWCSGAWSGDRGDRPFATRWSAALGRARPPAHARGCRAANRRDAGRDRARVALGLSDAVVAIPGARRPETARSAAGAATLGSVAGERADAGTGVRRVGIQAEPSTTRLGAGPLRTARPCS